jgi:aldehyde:ferredoxin oxidoreductase
MLAEYYAFREWDKNGVPTQGKLEELGLEFTMNGGSDD